MKTMTRPRYRLAIAAVAAATALTACGGGSTGADGGLPSNVSFGAGPRERSTAYWRPGWPRSSTPTCRG
ncbi:hypothetical protein ACFQV8_34530 [Pseudonocardia benzenivorans]